MQVSTSAREETGFHTQASMPAFKEREGGARACWEARQGSRAGEPAGRVPGADAYGVSYAYGVSGPLLMV